MWKEAKAEMKFEFGTWYFLHLRRYCKFYMILISSNFKTVLLLKRHKKLGYNFLMQGFMLVFLVMAGRHNEVWQFVYISADLITLIDCLIAQMKSTICNFTFNGLPLQRHVLLWNKLMMLNNVKNDFARQLYIIWKMKAKPDLLVYINIQWSHCLNM